MSIYLSKRADFVKFYLALWFAGFLSLWVGIARSYFSPFRLPSVSYILGFLIPMVGVYYIIYPLFKSSAFTAEKQRLLPFLPAALLLLHYLLHQLQTIIDQPGGLKHFSFSFLLDPYLLIFLFLGIVLYLLAAKGAEMDALLVSPRLVVKLFIALAFIALAFVLAAQVIQGFSKITGLAKARTVQINLPQSLDESTFENEILAKLTSEEGKSFLRDKVYEKKADWGNIYQLRNGLSQSQRRKGMELLKMAGYTYSYVSESERDLWHNYSGLGNEGDGGIIVAMVAGLVLLLIPAIGLFLLLHLVGGQSTFLSKLLKAPLKWLVSLPLVLVILAYLVQPETYGRTPFMVTAFFSILGILVFFLLESKHPAGQGIVNLAISYFLYPYRWFRKIFAYAKGGSEVTDNENAAIDYFGWYTKGAICLAVLLAWTVLALLPLITVYRLFEIRELRELLQLIAPYWYGEGIFGLLAYPVVFFIAVPMYTVVVTIAFELASTILQIFVKINKYFTRFLTGK